jgi:hypothetical protein
MIGAASNRASFSTPRASARLSAIAYRRDTASGS